MNFEFLKLNKKYLKDADFMQLPDQTKWHYIGMYILAGEAMSEGIVAQNKKPLDLKNISFLLNCSKKELEESLKLLLDIGLIIFENDYYFISRFIEEQGPDGSKQQLRKYWSEKQKEYRDNIKKENNINIKEEDINNNIKDKDIKNNNKIKEEEEDKEEEDVIDMSLTLYNMHNVPMETEKEIVDMQTLEKNKRTHKQCFLNHFKEECFENADQELSFDAFYEQNYKRAIDIIIKSYSKKDMKSAIEYLESETLPC